MMVLGRSCRVMQRKWCRVFWVFFVFLIGGVMNTSVQSRPVAEFPEYERISPDELIQVYRQAYSNARFVLKKERVDQDNVKVSKFLTFEFSVVVNSRLITGEISINIWWKNNSEACSPCVVSGGALYKQVSGSYDEREVFMKKFYEACLKVDSEIQAKLGNNIKPRQPYQGNRNEQIDM